MPRVLVLLTVLCVTAVAFTKPHKEKKGKILVVDFNRDINAKIHGQVKFGPCGRPRSKIDVGIQDQGETKINGNAFQALETIGKFAEFLKLLGNRFKPEVNCPPRPASNVDTSAEGISIQRTVVRKPRKSSGRFVCKHRGKKKRSGDKSKKLVEAVVKVYKARKLPSNVNRSLEKANQEYRDSKYSNQRHNIKRNHGSNGRDSRKKRREVKKRERKSGREKGKLRRGFKDFQRDVMKNINSWSSSLKKRIYRRSKRTNKKRISY